MKSGFYVSRALTLIGSAALVAVVLTTLFIGTPFASAQLCDADCIEVSSAQAALATAATLNPAEGVDSNAITMAQAIVDAVPTTGVVVTIDTSANTHVAAPGGAITYDAAAETGDVTFVLTKNAYFVSQTMSVVVPMAAPDYAAIFGAIETALLGEGVTTNIVGCAGTPTACSTSILRRQALVA